jgi:sugar/nucleoside kinase (ribokinase family)
MTCRAPARTGLFVGLTTLDIIHNVARMPLPNEKITATEQTLAAGGPAANASVTFGYRGGSATLATVVGRHGLTEIIRADLASYRVRLLDATPERDIPPPVSAIAVTAGSGDRAVVSYYAPAGQPAVPELLEVVRESQVVLVDGHHPELAVAALRAARQAGRPTVLDGGRWRASVERLLPGISVAICSTDFRPPGCLTDADVFGYLARYGVRWAAITHGGGNIAWRGPTSLGELPVPEAKVVDTLAAGDVLHGSFCYELAGRPDLTDDGWFASCLARASLDATRSCGWTGSRSWMGQPPSAAG